MFYPSSEAEECHKEAVTDLGYDVTGAVNARCV